MISHLQLDLALLASLALAAVCLSDDLLGTLKGALDPLNLRSFPLYYEPQFDFINHPFDPLLAVSIYITGVYFLIKTYWLEKDVIRRAHKKFKAQGTKLPVAIHGIGSIVEMLLGCIAVCQPENAFLARSTAWLALLVNIPSAIVLTPRVFGIKYLTVPGFGKFAVLRALEAIRVLVVHPRLVANLWILLQVGTMVRLLGWFVLPYTPTDGPRGSLFTDPSIYSFNILLSGFITGAFVYPPKYLLVSLGLYAAYKVRMGYRISVRTRPIDAPAAAAAAGTGNKTDARRVRRAAPVA